MSPVHTAYGKAGLLPNKMRQALSGCAVSRSGWVMVDTWESSQPGHTTTLPVLRSVRERLQHTLSSEEVRVLICAVHVQIKNHRDSRTLPTGGSLTRARCARAVRGKSGTHACTWARPNCQH